MPTLDEEIYEIMKVCFKTQFEEELREMAGEDCPLVEEVTKEETLLLYKLWRCYKMRAENKWRTKYFKGRSVTYTDEGADFFALLFDISNVKQFVAQQKVPVAMLLPGLKDSFLSKSRYSGLSPDTDLSEYLRFLLAAAAACEFFLSSALPANLDNTQQQLWLRDIICEYGYVFDVIDILRDTEGRSSMVPKKIEIKTDADMISALEACTSKAKEWRATIEKLQADNEGLKKELEAKEAKINEQGEKIAAYAQDEKSMEELKKENEALREKNERLLKQENVQRDDEAVRRSHYCEFLFHFMEAGKGMKDKAAIGLFLQTATRPEKWLPTEIDDEIAHFHEREQFDAAALASVLAKGGINIQQLNMGNGTQGLLPSTLLPSTDNEKK